jgi:hypothetical protein
MTDKKKIEVLKQCFEDTIWMAIRYAHGRHTYAPSMVRDAVNRYKEIFPDFKLNEDQTLEPIPTEKLGGFLILKDDYLNDLFDDTIK